MSRFMVPVWLLLLGMFALAVRADTEHGLDYNLVRLDAEAVAEVPNDCLLYTSPSPRDRTRSRMPSSA